MVEIVRDVIVRLGYRSKEIVSGEDGMSELSEYNEAHSHKESVSLKFNTVKLRIEGSRDVLIWEMKPEKRDGEDDEKHMVRDSKSVEPLTLDGSAIGVDRGKVFKRALRVSLHRRAALLPVCGTDFAVFILRREKKGE
jgi:hypothetical protein